jgi:HTTM domain/Vitamin K-dependent gamma-carboxylase, lumenal domain
MVTQASSGEAPGPPSLQGRFQDLLKRLLSPVDIASLVFFRIFFGVIVFWHVWLQMPEVRAKYIEPDFHFKYPGFGWVDPLPGELMQVVFLVMAASTVFVALGLFYRYAAVTFFVLHTYVLLIDQVSAWNHYYLISLLGFLLIFIPANRAFSLDVARGGVVQSDDVPAWSLWLLRVQMGIVYFFAGLAKLSSSDWLDGKPMNVFLANHTNFPLVGRRFTEDWAVYGAAYSGMLFDLLIIPMLLWRRTRVLGLVVAVTFHLSNSLIFNIQIFPWLALVATLLFLPPSWPRLGGQWRRISETAAAFRAPPRFTIGQTAVASLLGIYFLVQIVLPLRHYFYDGNAEWTNAGHYHAWRMLLADMQGETAFFLVNKDPPALCEIDTLAYVYPQQTLLLYYPDAMVQFARYLGQQYEARGAADFEVHVWTSYMFNGREARGLIDPDADLLAVHRPIAGRPSWVIDLDDAVPLKKPEAERCPDPARLDTRRSIGEVEIPQ